MMLWQHQLLPSLSYTVPRATTGQPNRGSNLVRAVRPTARGARCQTTSAISQRAAAKACPGGCVIEKPPHPAHFKLPSFPWTSTRPLVPSFLPCTLFPAHSTPEIVAEPKSATLGNGPCRGHAHVQSVPDLLQPRSTRQAATPQDQPG